MVHISIFLKLSTRGMQDTVALCCLRFACLLWLAFASLLPMLENLVLAFLGKNYSE